MQSFSDEVANVGKPNMHAANDFGAQLEQLSLVKIDQEKPEINILV